VWLVEHDNAPAGYAVLTYGYSLEFLGRDAFVDEVYLRPAYRGRGWGRQTLRALEKSARAAGVNAIHLEAMRGNNRARRVYRQLGFSRRPSELMSKLLSVRRRGG
jgi:GNAT superfamily N-acetyltransferase